MYDLYIALSFVLLLTAPCIIASLSPRLLKGPSNDFPVMQPGVLQAKRRIVGKELAS